MDDAPDHVPFEVDFKRINALIQEFERRVAGSALDQVISGRMSQTELARLRALIQEVLRLLEGEAAN
jgi:hypothetical protein